ncbi:MAG: hypothetical protein KKA67_13995 [Spirochaetes bacterium]|nr:hypothetical protein [Spirochaetota bacterium]MBU1080507.1 hypothetical protein [Spirochaetota bacterium]
MIKKRPIKAAHASFALALLTLLALNALCPSPAVAQSLVSVLPSEPPSSLFSAKLGDADVEAFAQGFWEASMLSSGTFSFGSSLSNFNMVPFLFTQTPDLYVFLRFKRKWLLEAYVAQEASDALFLLAFEGDDADFIRAARLGNAKITMPDYPFMAFGAPEGSFGAALAARDAERGISIDAMVRWDGLDWRTRTFFGGAEAQETALSPRDHLRGRRFALGDTAVTGLVLTDTTASGSRTLSPDEYSATLASGVILLGSEPKGVLRAAWTGASGAHSGVVLYELSVAADGAVSRADSGYEVRNLYALPDTSSARRLFVRNLATGQADTRFSVTRVQEGLVQVVRGEAPPGTDGYSRPFYQFTPWTYETSSDAATLYSAGEGFSIVASVVESAETIALEQGTAAGTIAVYRDGVESSSFEYDAATGALVLLPPPRAGELVRVGYAVASPDRSDGALAFGLGSRFPWLGLDWAAALGGRWPLFGLGYDEGGEAKTAWTGASAEAAMQSEAASFKARAMARYLRAGASGLYRVSGMEDGSAQKPLVPFRAVEGDTLGIVASSVAEAGLAAESAFAGTLEAFHSTGIANRALSLAVDPAAAGARGGATRFVRYVDDVPLSSYEALSFFVKADGATSGSTLRLTVGDGEGAGAAVFLPLSGLGDGWRRVSLELGPAARVGVSSGDGSTVAVLGASGSFAVPDAAGLVEIVIEGLESGSVLVDEIALEGARDGFSALAAADFSLGLAPRKEGPYLAGAASGVVGGDTSFASSLEAGWVSEAFAASVAWSPAATTETFSNGLAYSLAVPSPGANTRIVDQYSRDASLGTYGRSIDAALAAGGFSASARAKSAEELATLGQEWSAKAALGGIASVSATASLAAPVSALAGLGIADSWLESWRLALPTAEAQASSRRLEASASLLGAALSAKAGRSYDAVSPTGTKAEAKASLPFALGPLSIAPYYSRTSWTERASSAASFGDDLAELYAAASDAAALWAALPIAELWETAAFADFYRFSEGASAAEHEAEIGLEIRRPIGYGLVDLLVPSSGAAAYSRAVSLADDTSFESSTLSLTMAGGAANVFAASGAVPTLLAVAFDEYSYKTALSVSYYPSDGAFLPSVSSNLAVSMEAYSGSRLALATSFSYARARSAEPWSGALSLALNTRPARSWLGDLAALAIKSRAAAPPARAEARAEAPITADVPAGAQGAWVSAWLDAVLGDPLALKDSFAFEGSVGKASAVNAPLVARISLDYSTKVVAGGSLTVGAGAGVWQLVTISAGSSVWGFGYSIRIDAKVVF